MTATQPSTISTDLLRRLIAASRERPINNFTLRTIERDVDKLERVDLIAYTTLKGALAAIRKDAHEAKVFYERAVAFQPGNALVYQNYAISMQLVLDYEHMVKLALKSAETAPDNVPIVRVAHNLLMQIGAVSSAREIAALAQRLKIDLSDADAAASMLNLMQQRGVDESELIALNRRARAVAQDFGFLRGGSRFFDHIYLRRTFDRLRTAARFHCGRRYGYRACDSCVACR